jgi:hypothetical protein
MRSERLAKKRGIDRETLERGMTALGVTAERLNSGRGHAPHLGLLV